MKKPEFTSTDIQRQRDYVLGDHITERHRIGVQSIAS